MSPGAQTVTAPSEATPKWSRRIRMFHRWLSVVFTALVAANFLALMMEEPPMWLGFLALPPLFLLLFSGMYLFVLPYTARRRGGRPTD